MKKVMVFNFKNMKYEQATEAEGKELLDLIESMNANCAAQHSVKPTSGTQSDTRGKTSSKSKRSE